MLHRRPSSSGQPACLAVPDVILRAAAVPVVAVTEALLFTEGAGGSAIFTVKVRLFELPAAPVAW